MIVSYWLTWQFTVFVSIYLYDVKMVIAFNYKEASKTVTLKEVNGSIIECSGAPSKGYKKDIFLNTDLNSHKGAIF